MSNPTHRAPSPDDYKNLIGASTLDQLAQQALVSNLDDTVLLGCVGLGADQIDAADATLVSVVCDMSGSMAPHKKGVIDAFNTMLAALTSAKAASAILVSLWAFSDSARLLSSYEPIDRKAQLGPSVYVPDGGTALYDTTLAAMAGLVAYGQRLFDEGVPTKRILFVLSDGDDNASKATSAEVKAAATALSRQEAYTLAYAGFGNADLAGQADAIGFPHVITTSASASELRRIFRQVSQSVLRVSQGTMPAAGGFF
ncbi:MAG: hypothetical protein HOW73_21825 [Polyangiaceae bacterium]|nr:hypothetical protein [Polyangiaceae bacterium]